MIRITVYTHVLSSIIFVCVAPHRVACSHLHCVSESWLLLPQSSWLWELFVLELPSVEGRVRKVFLWKVKWSGRRDSILLCSVHIVYVTYSHTHAHARTHTHTHTHARTHTRTHARMHAHTHTHNNLVASSLSKNSSSSSAYPLLPLDGSF